MKAIWKFPLDHDDNDIDVPSPYRIAHVGVDPTGDPWLPCVWIEVHPDAATRTRITLRFVGTGMEVPSHWQYHGSTIVADGLVWHVYQDNGS